MYEYTYYMFLRITYKQLMSFEQHFSILPKINPMTVSTVM